MSRTAHHTRYTHRDGNCVNHDCAHTRVAIPEPRFVTAWRPSAACDFPGPDHTLADLRYSAAVLTVAARAGARPIPQPVSATLPLHRHMARSWQSAKMGSSVRAQSRADRRRTAPVLAAAAADAATFLAEGEDLGDWVEVDAVVVAPTRHRRSVRADFGW